MDFASFRFACACFGLGSSERIIHIAVFSAERTRDSRFPMAGWICVVPIMICADMCLVVFDVFGCQRCVVCQFIFFI